MNNVSELTIIKKFKGDDVLVLQTNKGVMVKTIDVFRCLGYADIKKAIKQHKPDCFKFRGLALQGGVKRPPLHPSTLFMSQDEIIRLALKVHTKKAKQFEEWAVSVIKEVVNTGTYIDDSTDLIELDQKIRNVKATRESIDLMFKKLVDVSHNILKDDYTRRGTTAYIAQVMDAVYQVSLLKTASYIKYEQIAQGGVLKTVTTNQLRDKEYVWRIDFMNAINYMSDDDLEQVKLTLQELITLIDNLNKKRFISPTVKSVKELFAKHLLMSYSMIPYEVKDKYTHQLVHFQGIKTLLNEITRRTDKLITKLDQELAHKMPTRKAPFMN
jgi:prophage antirepressor-like protein